jgi:hypothetical protein
MRRGVEQMSHTVLTFVTPVKPHQVDQLRALLNEIGKDITGNRHIPFTSFRLLHFASLVLHEDPGYGSCLIFESNFDGPLDGYLDELFDRAAGALHEIYSCCGDYSAQSAGDRAQIRSYLRAHVLRPNAYYVGNVGRTLARVNQENVLRDSLEGFLDDLVNKGERGSPPDSIRQRIQAFVRHQSALGWALHTQPRQTAIERFMPWVTIVALVLIALVLLPVLIPISLVWLIVLLSKETSDQPAPNLGNKDHTGRLVEREDRTHIVQNHMASITIVKPGLFRLVTLRTVLRMVNLAARISTNGTLLGIPSIHFAHWALIDNGRRLLFVSNFDGSWENYLDDFIDKASKGLTAIWSNTVGFPRARFLVLDGASDGARFKAFARDSQRYTNVWYSAYSDLTVHTIDNNSAIREDLFTSLGDAATRAWLWRF